jgi:hypothetical protein
LVEEKKMKKTFSMFLAVAFALSMAGVAVAADNAVKPMKAAEKAADSAEKSAVSAEKSAASAEKSATTAKKTAKAKGQLVSGTIESIDAAAGTFTVKGKKGNVDLKAGEKVKLDSFKVGDKVVVKYAEGTASSVKAVKAAKAAKKAAAKAEKSAAEKSEIKAEKAAEKAKELAPAPTAVPAPAEKK